MFRFLFVLDCWPLFCNCIVPVLSCSMTTSHPIFFKVESSFNDLICCLTNISSIQQSPTHHRRPPVQLLPSSWCWSSALLTSKLTSMPLGRPWSPSFLPHVFTNWSIDRLLLLLLKYKDRNHMSLGGPWSPSFLSHYYQSNWSIGCCSWSSNTSASMLRQWIIFQGYSNIID